MKPLSLFRDIDTRLQKSSPNTGGAEAAAVHRLTSTYLRKRFSASRVGFRISVVNSNAAQEGLSSLHLVFQLRKPVIALTEAFTTI